MQLRDWPMEIQTVYVQKYLFAQLHELIWNCKNKNGITWKVMQIHIVCAQKWKQIQRSTWSKCKIMKVKFKRVHVLNSKINIRKMNLSKFHCNQIQKCACAHVKHQHEIYEFKHIAFKPNWEWVFIFAITKYKRSMKCEKKKIQKIPLNV